MNFRYLVGIIVLAFGFQSGLVLADYGNSETVSSIASVAGASQVTSKFASYEACKNLGNALADCRLATEQGVRFAGKAQALPEDTIQTEVSNSKIALDEGQSNVYRVCRAFNNPADICFHYSKGGGLIWGPLLPSQIQEIRGQRINVSNEDVVDCVNRHAREASAAMGLAITPRLVDLQSLNNPNSFAARAVKNYLNLCLQGS